MILAFILPYLKKWLVILGLGIACYGAGFVQGINHEQKNQAKKENAQLVHIIVKEREVQAVADKVGSEVVTQKETIKTVYKNVDREVIKYVTNNPESSVAIADAEWLRIFNASALGCEPSEPTCNANAEVSGIVTRAEAIETIRQQHEIYQNCRVTVDGWQSFYKQVKETLNEDNKGTTTESNRESK